MATDLLPPPGEFKTTEEIRDAKYADELAAKRKRLLLWSAPLMLIALVVAIKLLSAVAVNMAGQSAYQNANHQTAADRFGLLADYANVIEPWKAHFNEGTAIYAGGDFFNASTNLEVALDLVPKAPQGEPPGPEECDVRTNLSLAYEGLGDEAMLASDFAMATNYYDQAQETLSNCGESGGSGGEEAQEAEERQEQSQSDAQEQQEQQEQEQQEGEGGEGSTDQPTDGESQSGDPTDGESQSGDPTDGESSSGDSSQDPSDSESGSGGESASETPSESVDPQQEELESRNQDAQQSADAEEQASGGGDGSGQNW